MRNIGRLAVSAVLLLALLPLPAGAQGELANLSVDQGELSTPDSGRLPQGTSPSIGTDIATDDDDEDTPTTEEKLEQVLSLIPSTGAEVARTRAPASEVHTDSSPSALNRVTMNTESGHRLAIPASSTDPVILTRSDNSQILIRLEGNQVTGTVGDSSNVAYEEVLADTSLVTQPQSDAGVRMLLVIDGPDAPSEFVFDLNLGDIEGRTVIASTGGAVILDKADYVLATIDAPWAFDSEGQALRTSYEIADNALKLHVEHENSTAYPIVADPVFRWGWISGTVYFNRQETQDVAYGAMTVAQAMVSVPPPFNGVVAWYATSIFGWATSAMAWSNKCLKVTFGMTWSWRGATPGMTPGHYVSEAGATCR